MAWTRVEVGSVGYVQVDGADRPHPAVLVELRDGNEDTGRVAIFHTATSTQCEAGHSVVYAGEPPQIRPRWLERDATFPPCTVHAVPVTDLGAPEYRSVEPNKRRRAYHDLANRLLMARANFLIACDAGRARACGSPSISVCRRLAQNLGAPAR